MWVLVSTFYVYLDESGDWEFSPKGSTHFAVGALWTSEPAALVHALVNLRFELLKEGVDLDSFHASPDKQATRDRVFATLRAVQGWQFAAVLMEKRKVNPTLRDPQRFYPIIALPAVTVALQHRSPATSRAIVFADTINLGTRAKREGALKAIKRACTEHLPSGIPHHAYSHRRESNALLQAVDYCLWAVFRKWERADNRAYDSIKQKLVAPELCITHDGGGNEYYQPRK